MSDSKNWSNFAAKQTLTMEQKFGKNSIDIEALREFCEREGKEVTYRKGDQLEREGDPALFRSCRGLFRGTFCNFVARNDSRRRLQHDVNAPNGIFPRKRSK